MTITTAYVSVRCERARSPVALNIGWSSAFVRHGRLSTPSPSIVAKNLPTKSAPHAYYAPAIHTQTAAPPFLH